MSYGKSETSDLRGKVEAQLNRLLAQLQDLDDLQDELEPEEIEDIKADTLQQMQEFEASLVKMMSGNITLVNEIGLTRLAIQAAISKAFRTPEVLKMFAKKDLGSLRSRLSSIQMNARLGKIPRDQVVLDTVEVLAALKKLGERLSPEELHFLQEHRSHIMADFDEVDSDIGVGAKSAILSNAANQIKRAKT
ncbi:Zinc finger protein [Pelomyxa schiedti]|nr:Zinc finger protein [Pelomyxa schiedti]